MIDIPKNCLLCGAEIEHKKSNIVQYECCSTTSKKGYWQSDKCKDRQIVQLQTKVEKLERVAEAAKNLKVTSFLMNHCLDIPLIAISEWKQYQQFIQSLCDLEAPDEPKEA